MASDETVSRVEENEIASLHAPMAQLRPHEIGNRLRCVKEGKVRREFAGHSLREDEGTLEHDGFVLANSPCFSKFGEVGLGQGGKGSEVGQQTLGDADG